MSQAPVAFHEDRVRSLAHSLWIEEGMPQGRAEAHWFKALEMINAEAQAAKPASVIVSEANAAKPKRKAPAAAAAKKAAPRKKG